MNGSVRNIIPFSAVDGPGNRTVIFLQGCNFNCWYCHNPETIEISTASSPVAEVPLRTVTEIVDWVRPYFDFTSGITISGGECSVQASFLLELCKALKAENRHILLDTNGHMSMDTFEALSQVTDGFMFDLKAVREEQHMELTGQKPDKVIENALLAAKKGLLYELRTVVFLNSEPEESLSNENVEATVKFASKLIANHSPNTRYKLIKYRSHGVRDNYKSLMEEPTTAYMAKLFKLAKDNGAKEVILI